MCRPGFPATRVADSAALIRGAVVDRGAPKNQRDPSSSGPDAGWGRADERPVALFHLPLADSPSCRRNPAGETRPTVVFRFRTESWTFVHSEVSGVRERYARGDFHRFFF